jgi:dTDP-4-dehydrorhamnose reductase
MADALVGYTGFVGSTLLKQRPFEHLYRSTNVGEIAGKEFDLVVCAGAPAQKWLANKDPVAERQNIERLIEQIRMVKCRTFVLISTVDVFDQPVEVDEETLVDETGLHAYGLHRRMLEKAIVENFRNHLIVRLPGLVGPGLRKNVIYDLRNNNNLQAVDSRSVFQLYPMINIWSDLHTAQRENLRLVHLTAEPVSVGDVAALGFGRKFEQALAPRPARYDFRSIHGELLGRGRHYQYDRRDTIQAIRAYAQSEPAAPVEGK